MIRVRINYSVLLLILSLLSSCDKNDEFFGSQEVITITRDVADFTKVNVQNDMDVYITQGNEQRVEITINENLQEQLFTEVRNNTLDISLQSGSYDNATFILRITLPNLERVQLNDNTRGFVTMNADELELEVRGSSRLELNGSSQTLRTIMRDDSRLNGYSFNANVLQTTSKDASEIRITCQEMITGSVSEAAKVFYLGTPIIDIQISDAGSLHNEN